MNVEEKIVKSKHRTKRALVGYNKIYATYEIGKLDFLPSYKDIMENKLLKIMNLREDINDNIEDDKEFQNELSQSLQFEEQVKFQLNSSSKKN